MLSLIYMVAYPLMDPIAGTIGKNHKFLIFQFKDN